jgi:hypothetical protein
MGGRKSGGGAASLSINVLTKLENQESLMRRFLTVGIAIVLAGCLPQGSSAQCDCKTSADACPLRTTGPLSKADIKEATDLLTALDAAKSSLSLFRDAPDSAATYTVYATTSCSDNYRMTYTSNCNAEIDLGTVSDIRELVNGIFKTQIEKDTCRLRALGVDVPRP